MNNTEYTSLPPYFATGFADGEGCFHVRIRRNKTDTRWSIEPSFTITLHKRDLPLLHRIKATFVVGRILIKKKKMCPTQFDLSKILLML
jgi:hypothetical protein